MNKRIAELKGLCVLDELETCVFVEGEWSVHVGSDVEGWACYAGKHHVYEDEHGCLEVVPFYDTDIACAMELFEEMFKGNMQRGIWLERHLYGGWICGIGRQGDSMEMGESASKAIAGAWLKWKESV